MSEQDPEQLAADYRLIRTGGPGWGSAFKHLRENSGLSQPALSKILGVHKSTITKWETIGTRPSKVVLRRALSPMGVPEELLLEHFGVSEKLSRSVAAEIDEILEQSKGEPAAIGRARIFERLAARAFAKLAIKALEKSDLKSLELFLKQGAEALEAAKSAPGYRPGSLWSNGPDDSEGTVDLADAAKPFPLSPARRCDRDDPQELPTGESPKPERKASVQTEAESEAAVRAFEAEQRAKACQEYIPPRSPARSRRRALRYSLLVGS